MTKCARALLLSAAMALSATSYAQSAPAGAPLFSAVPAFGGDPLCCDLSLPVGPTSIDLTPAEPTPRHLVTLPPAPDSVTLCLWALGGLGLWHLGRNGRRLHVAWHLPEWYHAGAARQVGHATPWDLDASPGAWAECVLDLPLGLKPAAVPMRGVDRDPYRPSSRPIVPAEPRGPPPA